MKVNTLKHSGLINKEIKELEKELILTKSRLDKDIKLYEMIDSNYYKKSIRRKHLKIVCLKEKISALKSFLKK